MSAHSVVPYHNILGHGPHSYSYWAYRAAVTTALPGLTTPPPGSTYSDTSPPQRRPVISAGSGTKCPIARPFSPFSLCLLSLVARSLQFTCPPTIAQSRPPLLLDFHLPLSFVHTGPVCEPNHRPASLVPQVSVHYRFAILASWLRSII